MNTIERIHIYPIKGMKALSVNSAMVLSEGLKDDRRYMLVDENHQFISQRTHPALSNFKVELNDHWIAVEKGMDKMSFSKEEQLRNVFSSSVWEHQIDCIEVSKVTSEWFSDHLNTSVKLVRMNPSFQRIKKYSNREGSTVVSFADGYPILILGTASLKMLNDKLEDKIDFDRFRANLIINTVTPHEEDEWKSIKLGDSEIEIIKGCARCQVVNINQDNGISSKEPLKTLAGYRQMENKIYFGANASVLKEGQISISDSVKLI